MYGVWYMVQHNDFPRDVVGLVQSALLFEVFRVPISEPCVQDTIRGGGAWLLSQGFTWKRQVSLLITLIESFSFVDEPIKGLASIGRNVALWHTSISLMEATEKLVCMCCVIMNMNMMNMIREWRSAKSDTIYTMEAGTKHGFNLGLQVDADADAEEQRTGAGKGETNI